MTFFLFYFASELVLVFIFYFFIDLLISYSIEIFFSYILVDRRLSKAPSKHCHYLSAILNEAQMHKIEHVNSFSTSCRYIIL